MMSALKEFGIILSLENAVNVQVNVSLRVQIEPHVQNEDTIWGDFTNIQTGFPGDSDGKESACNSGDPGLIPGLGRSSREGNGNPYENSMDRGTWWAIVHGIFQSTGVGCYFLLQGIFPTKGLNPGLPHCRQTLHPLNHQGRHSEH